VTSPTIQHSVARHALAVPCDLPRLS